MSNDCLRELAEVVEGDVVTPADSGYDRARLVANSRFDDARPTAVVRVAGAGDVRTVVELARDNGLALVARSGGHSFAGYSTGDCLVVDLGAMTQVSVDPDGGRATLGAGSTLLATYGALWPHRLAICGGVCPTVGIAGLTAGGGLGVLSRRYGLTCDNLVEAEIVTANGAVRRIAEDEHADLLWATRGGGGGSFGILTNLTFELIPVDMTFTELTCEFPWSAAADLVAAWQDWLPACPHETWSLLELETGAPGPGATPTALLELVHAGPRVEAEAILGELVGAAGVSPTRVAAHSGPFFDVEHDIFCKGLRAKECVLADKSSAGRIPRPAMYAKSDVASRAWPREGLEALVEWIERRQVDPVLTPADFTAEHTIGKVLIEAADGAVNSTAPDQTAFVHRDNLFVAQFQARWHADGGPALAEANVEWTEGMYDAVSAFRSGFAYQNYIDPRLDGWQDAYFGANLPRLQAVKSTYDPDDLFSFAQSVPRA